MKVVDQLSILPTPLLSSPNMLLAHPYRPSPDPLFITTLATHPPLQQSQGSHYRLSDRNQWIGKPCQNKYLVPSSLPHRPITEDSQNLLWVSVTEAIGKPSQFEAGKRTKMLVLSCNILSSIEYGYFIQFNLMQFKQHKA